MQFMIRRTFFAVLLTIFCADLSIAQMFSYGGLEGRATQSLSFTTFLIDFQYDGSGMPDRLLDWDGEAYGFSFNRRNFAATVVIGSAESSTGIVDDKLKLVDATITGWGEIVRSKGSTTTIGLPIAIHSGFRSVDGDFVDAIDESFSYTVLGLGTGVSFEIEPSRTVSIQGRAWPMIGMAFRSFEGFAGSATLLDADLQFHFMRLFGKYGLSTGYGFRWQKWNTNESGLVRNVDDDLFDYKSNQHMLRLGLNW